MNDRGSPLVRVEGISHRYDSDPTAPMVLRDIDLNVHPGELIMLTGPSGSGKTTLLTLIGALRSVQQGRVEVLGHPLQQLGERRRAQVRREIGFIFQDHNLFEALTVAQTLKITMQLHRHRYTRQDYHERPAQLLEALGLDGKEGSKAHQLSTGQKQRVAIGRALINQPRLILADEPTASLDEHNAALIMGLLRQRASEQRAGILMVTHDTRLFAEADRVIRMIDGRIQEAQ